jgi:feS-containing organism-specific oxidoreductase
MPAKVSEVLKGSIAEELEIQPGDEILSIDDTQMIDMIDYNFMCKSDFLTIEVKKTDGEIEVIELEKDYDEDLGIVFESAVFDRVKPCLNKCIFCFVDQQPKGLRETLYVKDDDYRLSYLQGTYITLTNLKEEDKERIKRMHLGPFYVSVHTTNPDLRVKMLRNPNAGKALENLKWFRKNKIPFHAQIVLCPGYNDGAELERTLSDLAELKNTVLSVAIVPVGITQFRKEGLQQVDKKCAVETLDIASKYKKVCCSDEFFLLAEREILPTKYYGNFCQLEDGVGALRMLLDDFKSSALPKLIKKPLKISFAASYAAKYAIEKIAKDLNKIKNLTVTVNPVKSNYWGQDITVAGLITTDDLINTVKDLDTDMVIIPTVMLKPYSEDFLDGKTLTYVKEQTGKDFFVVKDIYSMKEIVDYLWSKA